MKASFTVEAAIIVPMIIFTIAGGIQVGYDMFEDAKKCTKIEEGLVKLDAVNIVRNKTIVQEASDVIKGDK